MSLDLDARQRAMLHAMGITWCALQPAAAQTPARSAPAARSGAAAATESRESAQQASAQPAPPASAQPGPHTSAAPAAARARAAAPEHGAGAAAHTPAPGAAALRLHAPLPLYPDADAAQTPAELGSGWLIVSESASPAEPLAGDAGRLLGNMLRAMRLHRHPRVFLAALERLAPAGQARQTQPPGAPPAAMSDAQIRAALSAAVAQLRPAIVLLLGQPAARAALGQSAPLGQLRTGAQQLAGCPAVVSYDPAFLLRSQQSKAAAWTDLCRALALVRGATA